MDNYSSGSFLGNMRYVNILYSTEVFSKRFVAWCFRSQRDGEASRLSAAA